MTYVRRDSRNVLKHLSGIWFYFASGIILASIIAAIITLLRGKPEWATAFASLGVAGSVIIGAMQLRLTTRTQQLDFLFKIQEQFFFKEKLIEIREALDEERIWIEVAGLTPEDYPPYNPPDAKTEGDLVVRADDMARNVVEYEAVALSRAQGAAARSAWSAVLEWAASKRLALPPECQNTEF